MFTMRVAALYLVCAAVALAAKDYNGFVVYQVTPITTQHVDRLLQIEDEMPEADFWVRSKGIGKAAHIMFSPSVAPSVTKKLEEEGLVVTVLHQDVQRLMEEEATRMKQRHRQRRDARMPIDLNRYNRFDDIAAWLNETSSNCGSRCSLESMGQSTEGRPLWLLKITSGQNRPIIFLECGVHAREWIAPAVCLNMINKLLSSDSTATRMVSQYDWYIEPVANPDGYEYTHTTERMWRKTRRVNLDVGSLCVGTDPNRNFGHMWGLVGASTDPCSDTYMGSQAFSEPETNAIRNYVNGIRTRVRAYYAIHNCGQYILTPWSYTPDFPDDYDDLVDIGDIGADAIFDYDGEVYTVGQSTWLMGATAGSSDDWAKGDMNIKFSYTIEVRDTGAYCFLLPEDQIADNSNEIFDAFAAMSDELNRRFPMVLK